jgi:hypothetical protein
MSRDSIKEKRCASPFFWKAALAYYFEFYNVRRPHQSLDYRTPEEMYSGTNDRKKEVG